MRAFVAMLVGAAVASAEEPPTATQTGPVRRVIAADDSTKTLAAIGPDGRVEWKLPCRQIHDLHLLSDCHLLYQDGWTRVVELDADRKPVWQYDAKGNGNAARPVEVHAFQRLPDGTTMIVESGPARIIEVDRAGTVVREIPLAVTTPSTHSDTRTARKTAAGTYLVAHERDGVVREYDATGKVVWDYDVPLFGKQRKGGHGPEAFGDQVYSAVRLESGNTLIGTGNGHSVLEVTPEKEIVWKLEQNDLPSADPRGHARQAGGLDVQRLHDLRQLAAGRRGARAVSRSCCGRQAARQPATLPLFVAGTVAAALGCGSSGPDPGSGQAAPPFAAQVRAVQAGRADRIEVAAPLGPDGRHRGGDPRDALRRRAARPEAVAPLGCGLRRACPLSLACRLERATGSLHGGRRCRLDCTSHAQKPAARRGESDRARRGPGDRQAAGAQIAAPDRRPHRRRGARGPGEPHDAAKSVPRRCRGVGCGLGAVL